MKTFFKIFIVLIILVIGFAYHTMSSTGFFRDIEITHPNLGDVKFLRLPGVEDIAVARDDDFLILSSDDRAGRRDGHDYKSGLYIYLPSATGVNLRPLRTPTEFELYPHGISLLKIDSNQYRLLVVNHVSSSEAAIGSEDPATIHTIEEFSLQGMQLTHVRTYKDPAILSPNDVVALDAKRFYFTNDHGSTTKFGLMCEDYLGLKRSNVMYYDGANYTKVADGIAYANGINVDPRRNLLYVASPRAFELQVYDMSTPDNLSLLTKIDCNSGVDNIEIDESGKLWIGSHPNLLHFSAYAKGKKELSPSEIITIEYNNPNDYKVESLFQSEGADMSGSTVAVPYGDAIYLGNVMDEKMMIIKKELLEL